MNFENREISLFYKTTPNIHFIAFSVKTSWFFPITPLQNGSVRGLQPPTARVELGGGFCLVWKGGAERCYSAVVAGWVWAVPATKGRNCLVVVAQIWLGCVDGTWCSNVHRAG